ncbi:unnamed protein product [Orchesella dallaii]|uniref:Uncharacterized protein n=1 Tax=Orchesella dallaii TaxID=48710 RepID=A0ABP1S8K0_9HEXA
MDILNESNPPSYDDVARPTNPICQQMPVHPQMACVYASSPPTYEECIKNGEQSQLFQAISSGVVNLK